VTTYRNKVSGPLLDRIDLHVEVPRPTTTALRSSAGGEDSAAVAARVARAWQRQAMRAGMANALLDGKALTAVCELDEDGWTLLDRAADRYNLSARSHQRILRVTRTIADLSGSEKIAPAHVAEALSLRCLDRRD